MIGRNSYDREVPPVNLLLASWAPFYAGAEVAAERLAIGLRQRGHRVTVLLGTQGETFARFRELGLDVCCLPLTLTGKRRWWRYCRVQSQLRELLAKLKPDVVHANDLPTSQMIGQATGKVRIPRICHHRWIFGGKAIDWLNKFGAERQLFVSHALQRSLCHASPELASSTGAVVHDGLPLPDLNKSSARQRTRFRLGLPTDRRIVLFAGQIIERKGVADLLRAWALLPPDVVARAELLFVGEDLENDGRYRAAMEHLATELGRPVRFLGFQRNVTEYLVAADIAVVPSHAEPLGNATLEAMAHGLPVIGSRVGGIPEMIIDRVTGLLVPPRNPASLAAAIARLLNDQELRLTLGQAARARCERHFSLDSHVNAVLSEYQHVLERRPLVCS